MLVTRFILKARTVSPSSALAFLRPRTRKRGNPPAAISSREGGARPNSRRSFIQGGIRHGPLVHRLARILMEAANDHAPVRFGALRLEGASGTGIGSVFLLLLALRDLVAGEGYTRRTLPAVARRVVAESIVAEVSLALGVDRLGPRHDRLILTASQSFPRSLLE